MRRSVWLWLGVLAGAGGLYWLWTRTRDSGSAGDFIDEVTVTARKVGDSIVNLIPSAWLAKVPDTLAPIFTTAGALYGLPPHLLEAVAWRESRFRPDIIAGTLPSSKGALGVMQIIPRWHPDLGAAGALDPTRAIPYAARYLRALFDQFGSWRLALAAYNWGEGNLRKDLVDQVIGNEWPAETRGYVDEISNNAGVA